MLHNRYEQILEEMLSGNTASCIFCAARCILTNLELEQNAVFRLRLTDKAKILRLADHALKSNRAFIEDYIDRLFPHQVIASSYFAAVLSEISDHLVSMANREMGSSQIYRP